MRIGALVLFLAGLAQVPPTPKAILDRGGIELRRQMGGGQAFAAFWDGFNPGTEIEFRGVGQYKERTFESANAYRIVKRDGDELTLTVSGDGSEPREFKTRRIPPRELDVMTSFLSKPEYQDRELAGEKVKVGEKEWACRVFERTTKTFPQCGTDEPSYRLARSKVWWCPEVTVGGGILKVDVSFEEDWREGPLLVTQTEHLQVLDLDVRRKIGDTELACHQVSHTMKRKGVVFFESTELRSAGVPAGLVDARMKVMSADPANGARTDHWWIERFTPK